MNDCCIKLANFFTRKIYYFEIPAFDFSIPVSEVIGGFRVVRQYNFEIDNNFILRNIPVKPIGINFFLCIKYLVGTVY
jgi:hypothetical protein